MNHTADAINTLCNALGLHARILIAEYRDNRYSHYSASYSAVIPPRVALKDVMRRIIESLEASGYIVYSIYEILDGYTMDELERLIERDIREARSHVQILYLDLEKE